MQCWQCGATVRQGAKLCIYCGAKLAPDDAPDDSAPVERGRGGRTESSGGGSYGAHSRDDRDGGAGRGMRSNPTNSPASRSRGYDDQAEDTDGERYVPGRREVATPDARTPSRRSAGPRPPHGGDRLSLDPLDDPRAPRSLLKPPTAPRQQEPRRSAYDAGRAGHRTSGEASGHSGRGGYEHQGRRYTQGDLGYDPRYDPESGEYDAVADRRRREERYPGDNYGRRTGDQRDERYDERYDSERDNRGGRDERADRRSPARDQRGNYGGYDDAPSAEYSAQYPSRYDDAPSAEYSGEYPARYYDAPSAEYPADYSAELDARGPSGRDRREYRGGAVYDESAAWEARSPRRRATPNRPPDDSWNLPAISEAQMPATGWTGDWNAAPSMSAPAGRPGARGTAKPSAKRERGRGLTVLVVGLVALIAVAVVIVGVSERSAILDKLPGAPRTNAHAFATYTPGPTPTPVANYKEFSSDHALYVLNYPGQWTEQTSSQPNTGYDYVDTFTQQSPYTAVIVEQAAAFASITDADIVTAEINGGKQGGRTFAQTAAVSGTMSIGGEQWTRREYDVTDSKSNSTLHMAILTCHHAGRGYAIVLVATPDAFAKDDATVFKTVLGSFRFAS